ncbi:hypothetical protein ABC418_00540 [Lactiplantibacillus plantarum]|uniref:hypothetical protein n=1 Tax=Lactiplantibacillus plantarum TaxID=1590 RepID=UPI003965C1C5
MAKVTGNIVNFPERSHNGNSSYNGGSDMNKYVTHEELENTELRLNNKIDHIDNKIDLMMAHIDTKFESVNTKFESVDAKFSQQKVWLMVDCKINSNAVRTKKISFL